MMETRNITWLCLLLLSALLVACGVQSSVTPQESIYGSWQKQIVGVQGERFLAGLEIDQDHSYVWLPLEDAPGHSRSTARFTLAGDRLSIVADADCGSVGHYLFMVKDGSLSLAAAEDGCEPRKMALQGAWSRRAR